MPTPERPLPSQLRGISDPAKKVRPVDWTPPEARRSEPEKSSVTAVGISPRPAAPTSPQQDRKDEDRGVPQKNGRSGENEQKSPAEPPAAPAETALARPIYTLASEDERPRPQPIHLPPDEYVHNETAPDATFAQVVEVVADPEEEWSADLGHSDHFLRGELCVQVRRADNTVLAVFSRGYALAVRPDIAAMDEAARTAHRDGLSRRPSGGIGTRYPTDENELLRWLQAAGFRVNKRGKVHGKITHPDAPGLVLPWASSPSDVRHTRHVLTQVRRVFGIDLRRGSES
ncbi:hypothetical protein KRX56_00340 [Dermabacteraceae bacterium TAE3-ERU27]|nr:hypothetical protein [Dermabacteraceae bacterium TAE3-ERU27]